MIHDRGKRLLEPRQRASDTPPYLRGTNKHQITHSWAENIFFVEILKKSWNNIAIRVRECVSVCECEWACERCEWARVRCECVRTLLGGMRSAVILDQAWGAMVLHRMLYLAPSLETVLEKPTTPILAAQQQQKQQQNVVFVLVCVLSHQQSS